MAQTHGPCSFLAWFPDNGLCDSMGFMDVPVVVLTLDSRRRASLGRIGRTQDTRYWAETLPNGTIVLRPKEAMRRYLQIDDDTEVPE